MLARLRPGEGGLFAVAALLFVAGIAATIQSVRAMAAMGVAMMCGDGPLPTAWLRMPGQGWSDAAAMFLAMWMAMMAAMMMPVLVAMLRPYHRALARAGARRPGRLTALAGGGYFFVWALAGLAVYPPGAALAAAAMGDPALARALVATSGGVLIGAGLIQFSHWKAHALACCGQPSGPGRTALRHDAASAWRHGLQLGLRCGCCCANLMAILLAVGIMDLGAMVVVTLAIGAERLLPAGRRIARAIGMMAIVAGLLQIARVAGWG